MYRIFIMVLLVMFFLSAAGCSSTGGPGGNNFRGDLYDKAVREYPDSRYLSAVGSGQTEPEARKSAVSELSRIFVSKVRSEAVDTVRSIMVDRRDERLEETLFSKIEVVSELELEGVEIPEVWKEGATYYALSVLERQKAARGWKLRIEDIDSRIEGALAAAGSGGSRLLRYRALGSVSSLWAERAVFMSRLNVLGFSAPSSEEGRVRDAIGEREALKAEMRLFLDIRGGEMLAEGLAESLGREGFVLVSRNKGADVVISGSVDVKGLDMDVDDWKYVRATVAVAVKDPVTGESVGEVSENIRSAHISYSEASSKAMRSLTPRVSTGILNILNQ